MTAFELRDPLYDQIMAAEARRIEVALRHEIRRKSILFAIRYPDLSAAHRVPDDTQ